ncbi:MAG: transglycosylase domain-containing protein [Deltaproteobacteria bacterium]|nr:transglycosylase domain-containing protein [Deltaproteobacteria bacterium]
MAESLLPMDMNNPQYSEHNRRWPAFEPIRQKFQMKKCLFLILLVCVLLSGVSFIIERRIGGMLPVLVNHLQQRYGYLCRVDTLHYAFPNGIRAKDIILYTPDGKPCVQASGVTARISFWHALINREWSTESIRSLSASDLEIRISRSSSGNWEIPVSKKPAGLSTNHRMSGSRPLQIEVNNLILRIQREKRVFRLTYEKIAAHVDLLNRSGRVDIKNAEERLTITYNPKEGTFDIRADAFCLAALSAILPLQVPFDRMYVDGKARMIREQQGQPTFTLNGCLLLSPQHRSMLTFQKAAGPHIEFDITGIKKDWRYLIRQGRLNFAGQTLAVGGYVEERTKPVVNLSIHFPQFSFGEALKSLPASFIPDLMGPEIEGMLNGRFRLFIDFEKPQSLDYRFEGEYKPIRVLSLGRSVNVRALKTQFRHKVRRPNGKNRSILVGPGNPNFIPYEKIPRSLLGAVLTAEDGSFFTHRGFSQRHIRDSIVENLKSGRIVRGASTITMQLAKNLYLSNERNFSRKLEESLITIVLEQQLTKERILEIYLNIIEWGQDLYGIGPAAHFYFQKKPHDLTPLESAFLASIIARPRKNWQPDPLPKISDQWRRYLHVILCHMYRREDISAKDLLDAGVPEEKIRSLMRGNDMNETAPLSPDEEESAEAI